MYSRARLSRRDSYSTIHSEYHTYAFNVKCDVFIYPNPNPNPEKCKCGLLSAILTLSCIFEIIGVRVIFCWNFWSCKAGASLFFRLTTPKIPTKYYPNPNSSKNSRSLGLVLLPMVIMQAVLKKFEEKFKNIIVTVPSGQSGARMYYF